MSSVPDSDAAQGDLRGRLMQQLRRKLGHWEAVPAEDAEVFSSGAAAIDRLLSGGGLRHGMLVEWIRASGGGAATLALLAAREACREGGMLVVLDRQQTFYPPSAAAWGIDLDRLIIVRPRNARDELWAAVQSLHSPAVAAVWGAIDRLDSRAFRRLQLAAQAGRSLGLLLRPSSARGQPSWADVRLEVVRKLQIANWRNSAIENLRFAFCNLQSLSPVIRRVQIQVLRTRAGRPGGSAIVDIDDTTHTVQEASADYVPHPLSMVAELADPAAPSRSARA